ncbi:DUF6653 family protein [Haloarchaeobius litoreus]|uniref:DUF6653 family protein n=1 Tax=Haloarchaeobius litoreus TaxID=755306 RepID=A0ABD6DQI8_9EURY|nr:DUF6653 family protein [Haloarchaeobius litoreus]
MSSALERAEEALWSRHSNPKSGWTRLPTGAVIVYAVYRRDWRLLIAGLLWAAVNPFVFSPPETDDAWMTRVVLAERWWVREVENGTMGATYPNICNSLGAISFGYALLAAWRRRPVATAVATVLGMGLKLWWVGVLVRRYDTVRGSTLDAAADRVHDR